MADVRRATGVIENVPVVDFTHASWAEQLDRITRIADVAAVVVPDNLAHLLVNVEMQNVGAVIPVPPDAHVRVLTGAMVMGGEALTDPGDNEVLVVIGSLILTTPVTSVGFREMFVTGMVLAPHGSEAALGAGLTRVTGSVSYFRYAANQEVKLLTGELTLRGETLANTGGSPDDILVLAGQVTIAGPVAAVGFQRIYFGGQLILPRESEALLAPLLTGGGAIAWYAGLPRFFVGDETFGRGFFELVDRPIALALVGTFRIEQDVPPDLVRDKITEITLVGRLTAPKELIPILQMRVTEKYGELSVATGDFAG